MTRKMHSRVDMRTRVGPAMDSRLICTVVQKNRVVFLRVGNFAMVNGRKTCDMSKVSEFCIEKNNSVTLSFDFL